MGQKRDNEIAIIGIGCELPSGLTTPEALWDFLEEQRDGVVEVPKDRWSLAHFYDPVDQTPGKTTMRWGNFLQSGSYCFEPLFFGISPREGMALDSQQRLLLGVTWHMMEDALLVPSELSGSRTGVFVGGFTQDHLILCSSHFMRAQIRDQVAAVATPMTMLAARLAHAYGFEGPAMVLDTACSSSLVALHQACSSLRLRECDVALAGGVNFMASPQTAMLMTKGHFLAKDGRSKTFDASADGYGRGEGCVMLALKRLDDALRDGDDVRGVICGSGVNQDGRTPVLTMPGADAQERLIREVMNRAGVAPQDVAYVEAHGTGTPVGDPIEMKAISRSVAQYQPADRKLIVGSVKANLGHTEAAAGALGVLKTVLCLQHRRVPAQANLTKFNPAIPFDEYRVHIPQKQSVSLPEEGPLYAVVNSFGYGGTNAVALLRAPTEVEKMSAYRKVKTKNRLKGVRPVGFLKRKPLMLSAFSELSLKVMAGQFADFIEEKIEIDWEDICFSAVKYRDRFLHRGIVLPRQGKDSRQESQDALRALVAGEKHPALFTAEAVTDRHAKPVFVFSGMGPQWWGMGRYILRKTSAPVKALAQECDRLFQQHAGWSLIDELLKPEKQSRVQETVVAQPAIFMMQICLAEFFAQHGIRPGAIVGHSVGEVSAAYVSGALSLKSAVQVIYHRSRLQACLEGRGGMLAVGLSEEALEKVIEPYEGKVSIAAINAPTSCTLAGDQTTLEELAKTWKKNNVFARFLKVEVPYHSPQMAEIKQEMQTALADLVVQSPTIPLYSTVTGKKWNEEEIHDAHYWYNNAREPVRFADAIRQILSDEHAVFLEVSAHPVLGALIKEIAAEKQHTVEVCSTLRRQHEEGESLTTSLVRLILGGVEPDWRFILRPGRVHLPIYHWEVQQTEWSETEASRRERLDLHVHPILGTPSLLSDQTSWRADITTVLMPWLPDHRIDGLTLFPAAGYVEAALAAHYQLESKEAAVLENVSLESPLILQEGKAPIMVWSLNPSTRALSFSSESMPWEGDWQKHGQVTVLQAAPWHYESVNMTSLYEGTTRFEGTVIYDVFAEHGLEYGAAFRTLRALHRGHHYAVGDVELHETEARQFEDYFIHPALMDGAMHAVIGAFPLDDHASMFVPTVIKRFSYWGAKTSRVVVKVIPVAQKADKIEADLHLYTSEGKPVATILGLVCRRLTRAGQDEASRIGRLLYAPSWVKTDRQMLMSEPRHIAFLDDEGELGVRLKERLEEDGAEISVYSHVQPEAFQQLLGDDAAWSKLHSIVLMVPKESDERSLLSFINRTLKLVNAIPVRTYVDCLPLVVVTRGAYYVNGQEVEVNPTHRALAGFFRGVQSERTDLSIRCVDVPLTVSDDLVEDLAAEVVLAGVEEDTIVLRSEQRFIQRVVTPSLQPEAELVAFETLEGADTDRLGIRLTPGGSGALEGLTWHAYEVPEPGPKQVVLRTISSSLNFKDVLKAMSLLPEIVVENTFNGSHLGMEFVAEIIAIGGDVIDYRVGDRVLAVHPDSFVSHRVVDDDISMMRLEEEALIANPHYLASIPLIFVTAYYCLIRLAQLQKGETVLIHAAAGGVGQAAIQLARYRGATIYATAGSPEKREFLRKQGCAGVWDSRTLEFVDGVREATDGRGVDVVLNSLPGEAMAHSISLVARLGRFVEIGKRDIAEHRHLDLTPFNENLSFFSFDLDRLMPSRELQEILGIILILLREGEVSCVDCTIYPAAEATEAFRFLASSKHIGKVMLSFEDIRHVKVKPPKKKVSHIRADASYLITGGFGGLGLKTAEYLLSHGAGSVHLMGRRLPQQPEIQEAVHRLVEGAKSVGSEVVQHKVDVTDQCSVTALVSSLKDAHKPLRGIFHTAGIVEDAMLPNLTEESIQRVLSPKVYGSYVLDQASRDIDLDYFMLYSSFTTEVGNLGQSAYIAANSYLNGLAERRRQRGEIALAIGWGAVGDVGMLTNNDTVRRFFEAVGVTAIDAKVSLETIPTLLKTECSYVAMVDIDWVKAFNSLTWLEKSARFATVKQEIRQDGLSDTLRELFSLPDTERLRYVLVSLKSKIGSVLRIDPESISDNARLSELGIDSLAGVELQMAIRSELGVDVSLVLLARNETIIEMSRSLLRQISQTKLTQPPLLASEEREVREEQA